MKTIKLSKNEEIVTIFDFPKTKESNRYPYAVSRSAESQRNRELRLVAANSPPARDGMLISGFFFKASATSFVVLVVTLLLAPFIAESQMDFAGFMLFSSFICFFCGVIARIWEA